MSEPTPTEIAGGSGRLVVHTWTPAAPRFVVLLAHGYGEHARRYDHVADALVGEGAAVFAPDHAGHGRSDGERAHVTDGEALVDDLARSADCARPTHPGLPVVLLGHSMGGLIATRYAQRTPTASPRSCSPGRRSAATRRSRRCSSMDPIPEVPIDPAALSRDPAVGEAYAADPLVYHGPFRETLLASFAAIERDRRRPVARRAADAVAPRRGGPARADRRRRAPRSSTCAATELEEHVYPGARHEIFNETNQDEVIDDVVSFMQRALAERA